MELLVRKTPCFVGIIKKYILEFDFLLTNFLSFAYAFSFRVSSRNAHLYVSCRFCSHNRNEVLVHYNIVNLRVLSSISPPGRVLVILMLVTEHILEIKTAVVDLSSFRKSWASNYSSTIYPILHHLFYPSISLSIPLTPMQPPPTPSHPSTLLIFLPAYLQLQDFSRALLLVRLFLFILRHYISTLDL